METTMMINGCSLRIYGEPRDYKMNNIVIISIDNVEFASKTIECNKDLVRFLFCMADTDLNTKQFQNHNEWMVDIDLPYIVINNLKNNSNTITLNINSSEFQKFSLALLRQIQYVEG